MQLPQKVLSGNFLNVVCHLVVVAEKLCAVLEVEFVFTIGLNHVANAFVCHSVVILV